MAAQSIFPVMVAAARAALKDVLQQVLTKADIHGTLRLEYRVCMHISGQICWLGCRHAHCEWSRTQYQESV